MTATAVAGDRVTDPALCSTRNSSTQPELRALRHCTRGVRRGAADSPHLPRSPLPASARCPSPCWPWACWWRWLGAWYWALGPAGRRRRRRGAAPAPARSRPGASVPLVRLDQLGAHVGAPPAPGASAQSVGDRCWLPPATRAAPDGGAGHRSTVSAAGGQPPAPPWPRLDADRRRGSARGRAAWSAPPSFRGRMACSTPGRRTSSSRSTAWSASAPTASTCGCCPRTASLRLALRP